MGLQVVHKAWITCTQGTCPTQLQVKAKGMPGGNAEAVTAANVAIKVPTDGIMKRVNEAGQVIAQSTFVKGALHGESLVFDAAGNVSQKLMFAKGKLQGASKLSAGGGVEIHLPFHEGKLEGKAQFMVAGKKAAELAFHAGVRSGLSVMYDAEGRFASKMHFMNDVKHGLSVTFNSATGAVMKAEMYVNGALQAKGQLEAKLEAGIHMTGDAAFEAGLQKANSLAGEVEVTGEAAVASGAQVFGEAEGGAAFKIGGGLSAAASSAANIAAQAGAMAAAALTTAGSLAAQFGAQGGTYAESKPSATIMDHIPILNIVPFCLCISPSNPMVAAATTAALGVLTPMPCIPNTLSPWVPGAAGVLLNNNIALDNSSQLTCAWGGMIQVQDPGQTKLTIP